MHSSAARVVLCTLSLFFLGTCNDDTALLQVGRGSDTEDTEDLGELDTLLAKPASVFNDITSKVSDLEKHLHDMRMHNEVNIASLTKTFRKVLDAQDANNSAIEGANDKIRIEIEDLKKDNTEKRSLAMNRTKQNKDLSESLKSARAMIATAHEYVNKSIADLSDHGKPELTILAELDERDGTIKSAIDHQTRLYDVQRLGMLQVDSQGSDQPGAEKLLLGLGSGLTQFAERAQEGESQLKARFMKEYRGRNDHKDALLQEQSSLKAERSSLETLNKRLANAVAHLEKTKAALEESVRSVQGFSIAHIGNLGVNTSL